MGLSLEMFLRWKNEVWQTALTCASNDRDWWSLTPRLVTSEERGME